jgi:hypothetical protein
MTERDIDERAAIPDEETEPEESKEAIRAALWEAWTAGGARKAWAEGGNTSRPAPRAPRSFPRKAWPPGADTWPPGSRLMEAERADPPDGLGSGGRRLAPPAELREIGTSVAGGESGVADECGQSRLGLGRVRRDRLRTLGTGPRGCSHTGLPGGRAAKCAGTQQRPSVPRRLTPRAQIWTTRRAWSSDAAGGVT